MRKAYLAGPMRGYPQFNFPAFHEAAKQLRAAGWEIFSPAERDEEVYGKDFTSDNPNGDEGQARREKGFDLALALEADCIWICRNADAVFLLPGWNRSTGANAERALAVALGRDVHQLYLTEGGRYGIVNGED